MAENDVVDAFMEYNGYAIVHGWRLSCTRLIPKWDCCACEFIVHPFDNVLVGQGKCYLARCGEGRSISAAEVLESVNTHSDRLWNLPAESLERCVRQR